jgi:8-oxo-dGTP pyrophosphatase MutT (NUDIX family)
MIYTSEYPIINVAVDIRVEYWFPDNSHWILLIERANPPHQGKWALPGGFMNVDEDGYHAAARELKEETGLEINPVYETYLRCPKYSLNLIKIIFVNSLKHDSRFLRRSVEGVINLGNPDPRDGLSV